MPQSQMLRGCAGIPPRASLTAVPYSVFRHLVIEEAQAPPTLGEIEAIEAELGARLPASFVEYLTAANGGYLEYTVDVTMANGKTEQLSFCSLFSSRPTPRACSFVDEIRNARELIQAPPGVLPMARDGGSSMLYLDLSPEGKGRVVAYIQGLPEWAGLRTESGFTELAKSFDEYIALLQIDREALLDHLRYDGSEPAHLDAMEEYLDLGVPAWREDPELREAVQAARARVSG